MLMYGPGDVEELGRMLGYEDGRREAGLATLERMDRPLEETARINRRLKASADRLVERSGRLLEDIREHNRRMRGGGGKAGPAA